MASAALSDFSAFLRVLDRDHLDHATFEKLLSSWGYRGDSKAIFRELTGSLVNPLTAEKLGELYSSPTYTACEDHAATGRELMSCVKTLFKDADTTGSGVLRREDIKSLLCHLTLQCLTEDPHTLEIHRTFKPEDIMRLLRSCMFPAVSAGDAHDTGDVSKEEKARDGAPQEPIDEKAGKLIDELVDEILSRAGPDGVNLEQFASILLRYTTPSQELKIDGFDNRLLDPFRVSNDAFVSGVEDFVFGHAAANHHLLDSLQKGVYGARTIEVVANFLEAYRHFTRRFCDYLGALFLKIENVDHIHHLLENQDEENGEYSEDDIQMIAKLGLDAEALKGVPHKELFVQCVGNLRRVSRTRSSKSPQALENIAASLVRAFDVACLDPEQSSAGSNIAAMYFGSELLVSTVYGKISAFLRQDKRVSIQDIAFFVLHIDMDVEHALLMRAIVMDHCHTRAQRESMIKSVSRIMDARVDFYDKFVQEFFPPTGHGGTASGALYNKQSTNWVRKGPSCLSDFTGRPVVFDMCAPHVSGAFVLDVGSGEGYAGRKLIEMGAAAVTGIDVSSEMVARAQENATSPNETYFVGDAAALHRVIDGSPATVGVVPGAATRVGVYDLAVGIFVFNYTSIFDMNRICHQVHAALKPGGNFVFSVPHPFMLNAHTSKSDTFAFSKGDVAASSYYSLRDRKFSGTIKTLDGRQLNVKMCFKSISDYIDAVKAAGFSISEVHEARVLPEHVAQHPEFFESVKDSPLHIIFKVRKQDDAARGDILGRVPKKIRWGPHHYMNPEGAVRVALPESVRATLDAAVDRLLQEGHTAETYQLHSKDCGELEPAAAFARELRQRIEVDTGVVLVHGMNTSTEQVAKLSFLLLASLIGTVDGSARGRLFDVRDCQLNSASDNVLFSVSNAEATWHTDGASVQRAYSVASLLCIQPAATGGELRVSNAVNAFESLQHYLPKFLLYELQRALPRDVLENGGGLGIKEDILLAASRAPELLKHRVRYNAFPIFVTDDDGLRFRYMRYWIESGHAKARLPVSPLLTVAMDLLDQALEKGILLQRRMQPGEAIFCNNLQIAHARTSFKNRPRDKPRHKVRAWIQL